MGNINWENITKKEEIIGVFANDSVKEEDIFTGKPLWLMRYLDLLESDNNPKLKKRFFLGLNVRTNSEGDLKPVSICSKIPIQKDIDESGKIPDMENPPQKDVFEYNRPNQEDIDEGGRILDIENPPQEIVFEWKPNKVEGKAEINLKKENGKQNEISDFFKHPYGKSYDNSQNQDNKNCNYNILGEIHYNVLKLKDNESSWVWLIHFDRDVDLNNTGKTKYLSFILVVCEAKEDLDTVIEKRLEFLNIIALIKSRYVRSLNKKIKVGAIKSAKAAIMSRNLSHNLGSHVMSYMKQSLTSVEDMVKSGALMYAHGKSETLGKEMPFLVGLGKLISYLQERQDYIATVSTNYIPYPSVVNFKDAIYDELNSDYRFYRHKDHRTGYKPANLLLENIAKSEGLSRKTMDDDKIQEDNNIFINFRSFNGVNQTGNNGQKDDSQKEFQKEIDEAYEDLRRWNFSLPGGTMGRQAVFSIVENVIRNAAKHGRRNKGDSLTVTFDIFDPTDEKDRKRCEKDTFLNDNYFNKNSCEYGDLYVVTLTADTDVSENTIEKINNTITYSLNDFSTNLQQSNKGIKEMLISAAWLRSIRIEELEEKELKNIIPILTAREVEKKLQYVFCLPKVKEVALVSDTLTVDDDTNELMKKAGWRIFKYDEYCNPLTSKNFNFVIIDNEAEIEKVRKCSHNNFFLASNENTSIKDHIIKTEIFLTVSSFKKIEESESKKEELSSRKKLLEDLEKDLYKELAGQDNFTIAIDDKDYINHYHEHIQGNKVNLLEYNDNDKKDIFNSFCFFYRKHNDTEVEFSQFIKDCYGFDNFKTKLAFVEGISGGNSTDRLVRHGELDDLWAFKQIHAMRTKVAIFDERLFSKFAGYDPSMADTLSDSWREKLKGLEIADAKKKIREYDTDRKIVDTIDEELYDCKTVEDVVFFGDKYFPLSKGEQTSYLPLVMHKKGIDIFTLIPEGNNIAIWGYDMADSSTDGIAINYGKVKKIGVLHLLKENQWYPEVHFISGYSLDSYHYLTIHQGLLDKVYENVKSFVVTSENKLAVSQVLYNVFVDPGNKENDWLQGLAIHSGRSKPNTKDMPQHQPFIQYSALENAVYDCKYTLVELLDYACFETNE